MWEDEEIIEPSAVVLGILLVVCFIWAVLVSCKLSTAEKRILELEQHIKVDQLRTESVSLNCVSTANKDGLYTCDPAEEELEY